MLHMQSQVSSRYPSIHAIFVKPITYCLCGYSTTGCHLELRLKPCCCTLAMLEGQYPNVAIFYISCGAATPLPRRLEYCPVSWLRLHNLATWLWDTPSPKATWRCDWSIWSICTPLATSGGSSWRLTTWNVINDVTSVRIWSETFIWMSYTECNQAGLYRENGLFEGYVFLQAIALFSRDTKLFKYPCSLTRGIVLTCTYIILFLSIIFCTVQ